MIFWTFKSPGHSPAATRKDFWAIFDFLEPCIAFPPGFPISMFMFTCFFGPLAAGRVGSGRVGGFGVIFHGFS